MYYTPAILQLAGVTDKRDALLVALIPAAVNAGGTLIGMAAIDRCGRRYVESPFLVPSLGTSVV
jgi:MFS transporter, SP family, solute carrier family 2 (myo-inositol transporter), member 13